MRNKTMLVWLGLLLTPIACGEDVLSGGRRAALVEEEAPPVVAEPPPPPPEIKTGSILGRVCGVDGYWLSDAEVSVVIDDGSLVITHTDAEGYFDLEGVPEGSYVVDVRHGSFETSFDATLTPGEVLVLHEPVCTPPPNMAVVSGTYDEVEKVLGGLGFVHRYSYRGGEPRLVRADGNMDVVHGKPPLIPWPWDTGNASRFWAKEFLADLEWMNQYRIIFFNCGLDDKDLADRTPAGEQAVANLRQFVERGGSIYASDWASSVIQRAFPEVVKFMGDGDFRRARVGRMNQSLTAQVVDPDLLAHLQRDTVQVSLSLENWAVMRPRAEQPDDLRVMLVADVKYTTDPASCGMWSCPQETLEDVPLAFQVQVGQGRVLFTSAHMEHQTTPDLKQILEYFVFEL